jgi:DNA-binding SARP family transcriptional activator/tetratricopeptide (TPR) repeat protein
MPLAGTLGSMNRAVSQAQPVQLRLLGAGTLTLGGEPVPLPTKRSLAVLAMLALEGRINRQTLAYTLWDEQLVDDPRRNLRQELYRLSKLPVGDLVAQDGDWLELRTVQSDVATLEAAVTRGEWQAASQHSGELLERFALRDAPEFEAWLERRRAHLRDLRGAALEGLSNEAEGRGDWAAALTARTGRLNLDPWNERDHQAVMRLHAQAGQAARGVAHFEAFKHRLRDELGLEPLPETARLADELRTSSGGTQTARAPLGDGVRNVLEVAALLEDSFSWAELRSVVEADDDALSRALDAALEDGTVRALEGERYAFSDAGTRDALAAGLKPGRRRLLHTRLARSLERLGASPERIGAQLEGALEFERAGQLFLRAALHARRAHDHEAALRFADRAAELLSDPLERMNALRAGVQIEELRARLSDRDARIARMEDLAERSDHGMPLAVLERARWLLDSAQYPKALDGAQDLLSDALLEGGDVAAAQFVVGAALFRLGRIPEATEPFLYVLGHARKLSSERAGAAYHLALIAFLQKRFDDLEPPLALAERIAADIRHNPLRASTATLRAMVAGSLGAHAEALEHADRALEIGVQAGLGLHQQAALQVRSTSLLTLGRLNEALESAQRMLEFPANPYIQSVHRMSLANVHLMRGELGEVFGLFEDAIATADGLSIAPQMAMRRVFLGELRVWCGDFDGGREVAERAIEIAAPLNLQAALDRARLTLGLAAVHGARPDAARAQLEGMAFAEADLEIERLVALAQAHRALGLEPPDAQTDLSAAPRIQHIRWTVERDGLSTAALEALAAELIGTRHPTNEAREARKALLKRLPAHTALRDLHARTTASERDSLPEPMRGAFEAFAYAGLEQD